MEYVSALSMTLFLFLLCHMDQVTGLPPFNHNLLFSNSSVGSLGYAESNATAHGPGSTVGISGVVTGDSSTAMGAQSSPNSGPSSNLSSQSNCSDFSSSNATGSTGASATATGACISNIDNTGEHSILKNKEKELTVQDGPQFGMKSQVTGQSLSHAQTSTSEGTPSSSIQEAQIVSNQDSSADTPEPYQMVAGQQATIQFSGILSAATSQSQTDQNIVNSGISETITQHAQGNTNIGSYFETANKHALPVSDKHKLE